MKETSVDNPSWDAVEEAALSTKRRAMTCIYTKLSIEPFSTRFDSVLEGRGYIFDLERSELEHRRQPLEHRSDPVHSRSFHLTRASARHEVEAAILIGF